MAVDKVNIGTTQPTQQGRQVHNNDNNVFKRLINGELAAGLSGVVNNVQYNGGAIFGGGNEASGIANG